MFGAYAEVVVVSDPVTACSEDLRDAAKFERRLRWMNQSDDTVPSLVISGGGGGGHGNKVPNDVFSDTG